MNNHEYMMDVLSKATGMPPVSAPTYDDLVAALDAVCAQLAHRPNTRQVSEDNFRALQALLAKVQS